ncbi:S8 family peptidase [Mangrovibacillus cuniculi]|uniref:S8 family serine peptidase n=1 Tax=Mangrovibacillus cuniculi TaxID=2593652 RepID=A0A7S8CCP9_9BACI|nr:S8 family serine peptidase [Mangrovibacillus cuniculi]QPC47565.1 S8 family serine peptidase [Mangrovibacillus cuniculi]
MKKWMTTATLLLLIGLGLVPTAKGEETIRINVAFQESVTASYLSEKGIKVIHEFDSISVATAEVTAEQKVTLENDAFIKWIEEDTTVQLTAQQKDWGYTVVQSQHNVDKGKRYTGAGVKVGVIDTGINKNHPDLKIAGGISFIEGVNSYDDPNGHGTHVAGIIAALDNTIGVVGIAPDVELFAIRSLASNGYGNQSDIVAGVDWAIKQGLDIINLSVTTSQGSSALREIIEKAYEQGMIVVAASGNSSSSLPSNTEVLYPARYPEVIAVGSIGRDQSRSVFSYFGENLEFVAPGDGIYSTTQDSLTDKNDDYGYSTGTSMASPFLAATAALYKEAYPELSNKEIRALMRKNAYDLGPAGKDREYGFGLVKAPIKQSPMPNEPYSDIVKGSWYESSVRQLIEMQILFGYKDKMVRPDQAVTRAEAVAMIGRALGLNTPQTATVYKDVPNDHFASGYIREGTNRLWLYGYPDGTFRPGLPMTRGEVATVLKNAYEIQEGKENPFSDVPANKFYTPAVLGLSKSQIITGYKDGTFRPNEFVTRAELAVMIVNLL